MKKIELIIEAHKVSEVRTALKAIGVSEVATREVHADGGDVRARPPDNRLEIIVSAERAAEVIRAFASAGWSELLGDGKIVVYELADPVRVRTAESHENAH